MRELVRDNRGHPLVRAHAERAVAGVRPGDSLAETLAVRDYLVGLVDYRQDPNGVEWLQAPWAVFACQIDRGIRPQLDCDDLTMLALAPLESIGLHTKFRVVSHRADRQFTHVYGLVQLGREWAKLDLVESWRPEGRATPAETRALEVEVG